MSNYLLVFEWLLFDVLDVVVFDFVVLAFDEFDVVVFVVVVEFDGIVLVVVVVVVVVVLVTVALALVFVLVLLALLLVAVSPPQATPRAPSARTAESAIAFFISVQIS
ncbi:MAG: hypothetical protein ACK4S4_14110 [Pyrinomonadaceae bacterium]